MTRFRVPWLAVAVTTLMLFLYVPLTIATLYAFNDANTLTWPIQGLSLRWFERIFSDTGFRDSLATSLQVAVATATICTLVSVPAALAMSRTRSRVSTAAGIAGRLPVMLPALFIGVGLTAVMAASDWAPGIPTVVAGHCVVAIPWCLLVLSARLRTFDIELEGAARDLGAGPTQTFVRVTMPIVAPAILGCGLVALAWSFDETFVTIFTAGPDQTVPLYILARLRRLVDPAGNAIAVVMLMLPWATLALSAMLLRRSGGGLGAALAGGRG